MSIQDNIDYDGKDWFGNTNSVFATLGARNHAKTERAEYDYYATPANAVEELLKVETFSPYIWEPCAGELAITKVLRQHGYDVTSSDIIERGEKLDFVQDFLTIQEHSNRYCDIITNPPYAKALAFVQKAWGLVDWGQKIAMLLRIQFLEGQRRRKWFDEHRPKVVYVPSKRFTCAINNNEEIFAKSNGAQCLCWFVWQKGWCSDTVVRWIN